MNRESIVYVGDRDKVGHDWKQQRYNFVHGKPVSIREDFAAVLLKTSRFVREDDYGRAVVEVRPDGGTVLFRRWGALGDLLMFRAAVSAFIRARPTFRPILRCQERYADIFRHDPMWAGVLGRGEGIPEGFKIDAAFTFDQVAEADHRGDRRHRVQLFLEAMAPQITIEPEDWNIPMPKGTDLWVERHMKARGLLRDQRESPLLMVQTQGSARMKALPEPVGLKLVDRLADIGNVMLTEPHDDAAQRWRARDGIFTLTGRDPLHMISAMRHADVAVVMDSGPLWMAHVAACPIVAILGPTRASERVAAHPRYNEGKARAVALNDLIDCEACFEAAVACKGRYTCMQDQPDWDRVIGLIVDEVVALLRGDVHLPVVPGV